MYVDVVLEEGWGCMAYFHRKLSFLAVLLRGQCIYIFKGQIYMCVHMCNQLRAVTQHYEHYVITKMYKVQ